MTNTELEKTDINNYDLMNADSTPNVKNTK